MIKVSRHSNMLLGAVSAASYAFIAIAANFTTKYVTQLLPGAPDVVLLGQLTVMLGAVHGAHVLGLVELPPLTLRRWLAMAPMSIAYGLHAALVLRALAVLNVPMYNTLKRTTPMIVLICKWIIDRRTPDPQVAASVVVVVAGCVIAGKGDLGFNPSAYCVALLCAAFQAAYILLTEYLPPPSLEPPVLHAVAHSAITMQPLGASASLAVSSAEQRHVGAHELGVGQNKGLGDKGEPGDQADHDDKRTQLSAVSPFWLQLRHALTSMAEAMQYVSLTCIPVLAFLVLVTDQPRAITVAFHSHAADGMLNEVTLWLMAIACMELLLMGTLTLCTQTNSALTTTVVGVLKGTLAVALGFVLLGGVGPTTATNIVGITFNCLGGVWYAFAKYREGKSNSGKGPNSA